jgi:hypothetical protein
VLDQRPRQQRTEHAEQEDLPVGGCETDVAVHIR